MIEGSKKFMEGLALFPARFPFEVSKTWRLTIRGGKRLDNQGKDKDELSDFSEQFKNSVLVGAAEEMLRDAGQGTGGPLWSNPSGQIKATGASPHPATAPNAYSCF